jgi:hypothetical protein
LKFQRFPQGFRGPTFQWNQALCRPMSIDTWIQDGGRQTGSSIIAGNKTHKTKCKGFYRYFRLGPSNEVHLDVVRRRYMSDKYSRWRSPYRHLDFLATISFVGQHRVSFFHCQSPTLQKKP